MLWLPLDPTPRARPVLFAIVDPVAHRAWNGQGKPLAIPVLLEPQVRSVGRPEPGRTIRLLVFRLDDPDKSGPSMSATSKAMGWNQGFLPSYNGKLPYFIQEAQITPAQRTLDVTVRYDFGPWKSIVDFAAVNGKIRPLWGANRRPRMVFVPKGYSYTPDEKVRPEPTGMGPITMVTYDMLSPADGENMVERVRAWDARGNLQTNGFTTGLYPKYKTSGFGLKPSELRRFLVERRPSHEILFKALPMWPAK